jgi:hypothetical protein
MSTISVIICNHFDRLFFFFFNFFLVFYLAGMGCGSVVSNSLVERLRDEPPARPKTPLSLEVEEL